MNAIEIKERIKLSREQSQNDPEWIKIQNDLMRPLIERTLDILVKKGKNLDHIFEMKPKTIRDNLQQRFQQIRYNNVMLDAMCFGTGTMLMTDKTFKHISFKRMHKYYEKTNR